jgi:pfkB family carbohydrate kinase
MPACHYASPAETDRCSRDCAAVDIQVISRKAHPPASLNGWVGCQNEAVCESSCLPDNLGFPRMQAVSLPIKLVSVVGVGDSFLAAMVWSLACGRGIETAFRYGVAAGSAALLMPGTELCQREDVERLVNDVELQAI